MSKPSGDNTDRAIALLNKYGFDLSGYTARELVERWSQDYPTRWPHLAIIEALYQGRYKAVSVEQILALWQRRGAAHYHFNHEFERLICGDSLLPQLNQRHSNQSPSAPPMLKPAISAADVQHDAAVTKTAEASDRPRKLPAAPTATLPATSENYQTSSNEQPTKSSNDSSQSPIQQFHPARTATTDFHYKLKAIARSTHYGEIQGDRHSLTADETPSDVSYPEDS